MSLQWREIFRCIMLLVFLFNPRWYWFPSDIGSRLYTRTTLETAADRSTHSSTRSVYHLPFPRRASRNVWISFFLFFSDMGARDCHLPWIPHQQGRRGPFISADVRCCFRCRENDWAAPNIIPPTTWSSLPFGAIGVKLSFSLSLFLTKRAGTNFLNIWPNRRKLLD